MSTSQPIVLFHLGNGWGAESCRPAEEPVGTRQISLTAAAAGLLFSFRAILVPISARWLNWGRESGFIAGILVEIVLLLWAILQACGPAVRAVAWVFRLPCVRWVLMFLAFSCCSLAWSGTASRLASSMYWGAMAADVAIALMLLRSRAVTRSVLNGLLLFILIRPWRRLSPSIFFTPVEHCLDPFVCRSAGAEPEAQRQPTEFLKLRRANS